MGTGPNQHVRSTNKQILEYSVLTADVYNCYQCCFNTCRMEMVSGHGGRRIYIRRTYGGG